MEMGPDSSICLWIRCLTDRVSSNLGGAFCLVVGVIDRFLICKNFELRVGLKRSIFFVFCLRV